MDVVAIALEQGKVRLQTDPETEWTITFIDKSTATGRIRACGREVYSIQYKTMAEHFFASSKVLFLFVTGSAKIS